MVEGFTNPKQTHSAQPQLLGPAAPLLRVPLTAEQLNRRLRQLVVGTVRRAPARLVQELSQNALSVQTGPASEAALGGGVLR